VWIIFLCIKFKKKKQAKQKCKFGYMIMKSCICREEERENREGGRKKKLQSKHTHQKKIDSFGLHCSHTSLFHIRRTWRIFQSRGRKKGKKIIVRRTMISQQPPPVAKRRKRESVCVCVCAKQRSVSFGTQLLYLFLVRWTIP